MAARNDHTEVLLETRQILRGVMAGVAGLLMVLGLAGYGLPAIYGGLYLAVLYVLSASVAWHTARKLRLRRQLTTALAFEESRVQMSVAIDNWSPFTSLFGYLQDRFPPGARQNVYQALPAPLVGHTGTVVPLVAQCQAKRGRYDIGPLRLVACDPLGLAGFAVSDQTVLDFFIYPTPPDVPEFAFDGVATPFSVGDCRSRRLGVSHEFVGVRDYHDRDDIRYLHWYATARCGRLMVKEFEQIGATTVTIILDLQRAALCGIGKHSTTEYAIRVAAGLSRQALADGHRVRLLGEGAEPLNLPAAGGSEHQTAVMQALSNVRLGTGQPPFVLLEKHLSSIPDRSSLVLIVCRCDDQIAQYLEIIDVLRARQVSVTAVLIDHSTFLPVFKPHDQQLIAAAHQALLTHGVAAYRVACGDDLSTALAAPVAVARPSL